MNIDIVCIGNLKEPYLREAEAEYLKRLKPYCKINIKELREAWLPRDAGEAEEEAVRRREGEALLEAADKGYLFVLDPRGKQETSEKFAETIQNLAVEGKSTLAFIIGGSLGLSDAVRRRADTVLSFSEMTFPHQLIRIILLEQLYRSQKILRGEPYHK